MKLSIVKSNKNYESEKKIRFKCNNKEQNTSNLELVLV